MAQNSNVVIQERKYIRNRSSFNLSDSIDPGLEESKLITVHDIYKVKKVK